MSLTSLSTHNKYCLAYLAWPQGFESENARPDILIFNALIQYYKIIMDFFQQFYESFGLICLTLSHDKVKKAIRIIPMAATYVGRLTRLSVIIYVTRL